MTPRNVIMFVIIVLILMALVATTIYVCGCVSVGDDGKAHVDVPQDSTRIYEFSNHVYYFECNSGLVFAQMLANYLHEHPHYVDAIALDNTQYGPEGYIVVMRPI